MYRNIRSYQLRYTDVDAFDNLKLSSLLSFMQESACMSADELGFGYKDLQPRQIGFILVNGYLELNRDIKLGDELTIHTWPMHPKHMIFLREYEFYCGGEKVGAATARWVMISLENFAMLPYSAFFKESDFENYNTQRAIEFNGWKLPAVSNNEVLHTKRVSYSDYDHYFHANNTKYADFLMDVFSVEEIRGKSLKSMQITYAKQCKEGEIIKVVREYADGLWSIEGRVDGETRVQMRVKLD
ncbi:MAG: hypothetical protein K2J83_02655 [Clostridia bacterium]|nr:hypothetical protein [Clostridia bacterium]